MGGDDIAGMEIGDGADDAQGTVLPRDLSGIMLFGLIAILVLAVLSVLGIMIYVIRDHRRMK